MTVAAVDVTVECFDRVGAAWQAIPTISIQDLIRAALDEDVGAGDVTTALTVDSDRGARGRLMAKASGVVAGLSVAEMVMRSVDSTVRWESLAADGHAVESRKVLATCSGPAASILTAERVALNLIQRMSGTATLTRQFVNRVAGTSARILDTRKTAPGLRRLDKYAVVCGGGYNHRFGLTDGILIKDNHIEAAGGITAALSRARAGRPHGLKIEIEVDRLDQIEEAIEGGAEVLLLDNMDADELHKAVAMISGRALTEASGGVSLATVREIAETGVDLISVGQLTHSAPALDISLELALD